MSVNKCIICGKLTKNKKYCNECLDKFDGKILGECYFDKENSIKRLINKGCEKCPLKNSSYCIMLLDSYKCHNEKDEENFCISYIKDWMNTEIIKKGI